MDSKEKAIYYKEGVAVGRRYERERLMKFLKERQAANAVVVNIKELEVFIKEVKG